MPTQIKILPHYTYRDLQGWEDQWELIDGILFAMSPLPIPRHQEIAGALFMEFRLALMPYKSCNAYLPIDYKIAEDTVLQPDILIVCGKITKKFLDFPPALVVEILSPSTAKKDREAKFDIYRSQKIPYYLIIDPEKEQVEVYQRGGISYALRQSGHAFIYTFAIGNEKIKINFGSIW